jgi:hypothetical protein
MPIHHHPRFTSPPPRTKADHTAVHLTSTSPSDLCGATLVLATNQRTARIATRDTLLRPLLPINITPGLNVLLLPYPHSRSRTFTLRFRSIIGPQPRQSSISRRKEITGPLGTCSKDNKPTYSRQPDPRKATPPRARRQTGRRWRESAPGMVRRCPAG